MFCYVLARRRSSKQCRSHFKYKLQQQQLKSRLQQIFTLPPPHHHRHSISLSIHHHPNNNNNSSNHNHYLSKSIHSINLCQLTRFLEELLHLFFINNLHCLSQRHLHLKVQTNSISYHTSHHRVAWKYEKSCTSLQLHDSTFLLTVVANCFGVRFFFCWWWISFGLQILRYTEQLTRQPSTCCGVDQSWKNHFDNKTNPIHDFRFCLAANSPIITCFACGN
jgi:hypothetical protein